METIQVICGVCGAPTTGTKRYCSQHDALSSASYQTVARLRKAQKLAPVMIAAGWKPGETITDTTRRLAETAAGLGKSSEVTWALTEALMS